LIFSAASEPLVSHSVSTLSTIPTIAASVGGSDG
jgi:hypothetical protein